MTAKEQLSDVELDLCDKETLHLKQELDEQKATNQEMTANMKELQNEISHHEEKACSLFNKVIVIHVLQMLFCNKIAKNKREYFDLVDDS